MASKTSGGGIDPTKWDSIPEQKVKEPKKATPEDSIAKKALDPENTQLKIDTHTFTPKTPGAESADQDSGIAKSADAVQDLAQNLLPIDPNPVPVKSNSGEVLYHLNKVGTRLSPELNIPLAPTGQLPSKATSRPIPPTDGDDFHIVNSKALLFTGVVPSKAQPVKSFDTLKPGDRIFVLEIADGDAKERRVPYIVKDNNVWIEKEHEQTNLSGPVESNNVSLRRTDGIATSIGYNHNTENGVVQNAHSGILTLETPLHVSSQERTLDREEIQHIMTLNFGDRVIVDGKNFILSSEPELLQAHLREQENPLPARENGALSKTEFNDAMRLNDDYVRSGNLTYVHLEMPDQAKPEIIDDKIRFEGQVYRTDSNVIQIDDQRVISDGKVYFLEDPQPNQIEREFTQEPGGVPISAKMELDQDQNFLVVTQGADRFDIPIVPLQ